MDDYITTTITEHKNEIIFNVDSELWFMKMNKEGIVFNHENFPDSNVNDFAKAFMELMEKCYKIKFIEKDEFNEDKASNQNS